ncbi:hypothetical protein B842_12165 [Corynebacterium humireducens NBRC 106098 = DSM 45392]|uniref:Uncharacterized protein n=1 Tax=Corynebacterium humireducens NBRC 106098 = DSM 45392 TaxID=1223515 RepID=A0A0B5DDG4_9CORY|nr:hypothetical protein B842_12165 [Corynebacterium humireducens NBRC 106098 = DSM 45392]
MIRLLSLLLAALVMALPVTATAQGELGSVTVTKLPTTLDSPGVSPVRFELSGGDLTAPVTRFSDGNSVHFGDLTPGTYHVRELATRTGDIARATSAPFTVTIPRDGRFDVTAYPKPQPLMLEKSADVSKVVPGSRFTYILDGSVPLPDTNDQLHRYVLRDALPEGVTLVGSTLMQVHVGTRTVPLTEGVHYNVTSGDDRVVTATLTPAGLELLAHERSSHDDVTVRFAFGVRVSTGVKPGSHLLNIAHLYPDGYPETGPDSVTSNEHVLPVTGAGGSSVPALPLLPLIPFFLGSSASSLAGSSAAPDESADAPATAPDTDVPLAPTPDQATGAAPGTGSTPATAAPARPARSGLASTGASVLGVVALGLILTLAGITFMKRGRRD